ncbi:MAG: VOC family protein [Sphingomonas sp.]
MTDVRDQVASPATTENRANPRGDFIWYELLTTDITGAKRFYDAVVGWNIQEQSDFPNDYRMIGRSDGKFAGGAMQLTEEMKQHGARPVWLAYILVSDVDAEAAAIEGDGGKVMLQPFDIPNVGRVAMVTDPSGAPFYIMKPIPPAGDPNAKSDVFSVDQQQRVRWNELSTVDQDGAVAFYTKHFGWSQEGAMPMGEMGDYRFIYANGVRVGAIMRKPPQRPVSAWTFYIGVDDIDRAAEAVHAGGGQILFGPMEIPGGEYSLNGMDPQGAAFGLVGPRNK